MRIARHEMMAPAVDRDVLSSVPVEPSAPAPRLSRTRIVILVVTGWLAIALVLATQTLLGGALMASAQRVGAAAALRTAMVECLPWIPVTLAAISLAMRFPLRRDRWRSYLAIHVVAAIVLAFVANVFVVTGFWALRGQFGGWAALADSAMLWALLRLHLAFLVYGAIVAITQWVLGQQRARERELYLARVQEQLARANLQALNAQIRPHFLFNTLHAIGQMWRSGAAHEADVMLEHLGTLFRSVQASTSRVSVPLSHEVETAKAYLAIEQMRFNHRLRVSVAAAGECLDREVPPLVLQPIIENAVRHGVSAISTASTIDVDIARENGSLRMTVRDDGPGPDAPTRNPGSGTGITNTRSRLQQLYGDGARLDITAHPAGGTLVTIDIPWTATAAE